MVGERVLCALTILLQCFTTVVFYQHAVMSLEIVLSFVRATN